jgi:hypothetical protein
MRSREIVKRVLVTPDKHFPLHDQPAINCLKKSIKIIKPDVYVDLGDTGEWELFSNHHWKTLDRPPDNLLIPMLEERGYEFHPYFRKIPLKIGKLNFTHGHKTGMHHAKAHLIMYGESVIYGHTHDLQRHTHTGLGGTISAWSLGCLKDIINDEDWLRGNLTNWNHAFAIVDIYKNDDYVVQIIEIIKGRTSLWGELIDGNK